MKYKNTTIDFKSIKEMPLKERPREKLQQLGSSSLSDLQLLCCILGSGGRDRPVQDIAQDILEVVKISDKTSYAELLTIPGLGEAKASVLCASLEFGRRFTSFRAKRFDSPASIFNAISHYSIRSQEHFIAVLLNGALEMIDTKVITIGLVNQTLVHPREAFCDALKQRSTAVVFAHNHPSGNLQPSQDDIELTQRLVHAGNILGIKVLDHIIFSEDDYISMAENGLLFMS